MRKFKYKSGSHYSARLPYDHPAYQDVMISLAESHGEASVRSYMLCAAHESRLPLLITGKIALN